MHVLVTVGTTTFPALVDAILAPPALAQLAKLGYTSLQIQAGAYEPTIPPNTPLSVHAFAYAPSLADEVARAHLVVTHAGAGCLLEALRAPGGERKVVAVVNSALMDNHQRELALELHLRGHLVSCEPESLDQALAAVHHVDLVPFPAQVKDRFPSVLAQVIFDAA
ncbi:hypothetical protein GGF31_001152 [Allomyces arbusculus]|nr:hypothetical protein GGF31_001152 [Allomyces arbusculus]